MTAIAVAAALTLAQAAPAPGLLTYADAVREAQANNLDLKALKARLDQAQTAGWQAWSFYLPQVKAGGSATHSSVPDLTQPLGYEVQVNPATGAGRTTFPISAAGDPLVNKQNLVAGQVTASQALIAPSLWFTIDAAKLGETQAAQSVEYGRREVLFGVTQLYYGAVGLKYAVQAVEKQLAITLAHEKDARVRYEAGATPKVAFLRAEIDRAKAEQDLKAAQSGYDSARVALATLLGRQDAGFDVAPPDEVAPPPKAADLEAQALKDRYDVRAAGTAVAVAEKGRTSLWAEYLPNVGATGTWQWANIAGLDGNKDSWSVGIGLSWTLLDGTLREAKLAQSRAQLEEARVNRANAEARAREDVLRARLDLDAAVANRDKAKETVDLARENQRLVEVNYRAGAATYIEVADANNQLLQSELANITEQVKARLAVLKLLKSAGQFNP